MVVIVDMNTIKVYSINLEINFFNPGQMQVGIKVLLGNLI